MTADRDDDHSHGAQILLDEFIVNKRELATIYQKMFNNGSIEFFHEPKGSFSNYWLNAILLKDRKERDEFLTYTNDNGIMTRPVWTLMTKLQMFENCISFGATNAQIIEDRLVNIPSSVRVNK